MGKLTDSLKAVTQQLGEIQHGIDRMQELGQELADNTLTVTDAALRTGYAYAKAEAEIANAQSGEIMSQLALPSAPTALDADQLGGATRWTEKLLKARFGTCKAAYQYLRDTHGIRLKKQSWKNIVDAFNGAVDDRPPEQRIAQLEQTLARQGQQIAMLAAKVNELTTHLQRVMTIVEKIAD
jgi:ribosomal protein S15P/S13E